MEGTFAEWREAVLAYSALSFGTSPKTATWSDLPNHNDLWLRLDADFELHTVEDFLYQIPILRHSTTFLFLVIEMPSSRYKITVPTKRRLVRKQVYETTVIIQGAFKRTLVIEKEALLDGPIANPPSILSVSKQLVSVAYSWLPDDLKACHGDEMAMWLDIKLQDAYNVGGIRFLCGVLVSEVTGIMIASVDAQWRKIVPLFKRVPKIGS